MRASRVLRARAAVLVALAAATIGCAQPVQRSLRDAPLEAVAAAKHKVYLADVAVTDARAPEELLPLTPDFRYLVILVIWNQFASEGHLRPEARLYTPNLPGEMSDVVRSAFEMSGVTETGRSGTGINVKIKLNHLYGVTHVSASGFSSFGGGASTRRTFAAYGFAQADVEVSDTAGQVLGTRRVSGYFEPNLLDAVSSAKALQPLNATDDLTLAAVRAASSLTTNILRAVEGMLSDIPDPTPLDVDTASTFFIARQAPEGPFLEVAGVNVDSGEIVSDTVVRRWMDPFGGYDEWVVDPYFGGRVRLSPEQYAKLIARLQRGYDVRYVTDVRAAHFFGARRGGPVPPPGPTKPGRGAGKQVAAASAGVDAVILKNGAKYRGVVMEDEPSKVSIKLADGTSKTFKRAEIERVDYAK